MPGKSRASRTEPEPSLQQWEYLELLVGVGNEIWNSNGQKTDLREIIVGDPRFPRHYYSAAPVLNQLGQDGWEVTGIIGDLSTYILLLKRLKPVVEAAEPSESEPQPRHTRRPATRSVSERIQEQSEPAGE